MDNYKNIDKNEARKILNLPVDKNIVGYVGLFKTMGMEKGINTMILSLKNLSEKVIMVFIGGKDEEITEYKKLAFENGVLENVFLRVAKTLKKWLFMNKPPMSW